MKVIEVKGISKKYSLNHEKNGYVTFRETLTKIFTRSPKKEEFWALKDINFEIEKGEVIGVIGRNGAGKSTLLKILSQITPPTTGEIKITGTVGSLLEVGTGFHPELTGRENIFLNGAILGMKKQEIVRKFDKIVEFAGIEKFLDTPVKHYSSGMYVRLAFSVSAHMETDILIVDEVLAVGDAEFQKKCLNKMSEAGGSGKTVLFVSHNMAAIKNLCSKTLLLDGGRVVAFGKTDEIINKYTNEQTNKENHKVTFPKDENTEMQINEADISFEKNGTKIDSNSQIVLEIKTVTRKIIEGAYVTFSIVDNWGTVIYWSADIDSSRFKKPKLGEDTLLCYCPKSLLTAGKYFIHFAIVSPGRATIFHDPNKLLSFEITEPEDSLLATYQINTPGYIAIPSMWSVKN